MAKMKKGTHVGLDNNYKNVCVGDQIKNEDGLIFTIDEYGRAVAEGLCSTLKLSEIEPFELYQPEPAPIEVKDTPDTPPEPEKELDPGPLKGFNPGDTSVHDAPDQMLADELRRRGYDVKATKTTIVEL